MKHTIIIALFFCLLWPNIAGAEEIKKDEIFRARVTAVVAQEEKIAEDGSRFAQQNLKLIGLEGEYKGKEFAFNGIGDIDVLSKHIFAAGDKVTVAASQGPEGEVNFYVVDFVRTDSLWLLAVLFLAALFLIGRFKGLRSLLSLFITFAVILKYLIPQILSGANPLWTTAFGSGLILLVIIYITEGFCSRAHLSALSIFISLTLTVALADIFVALARLTGVTGEEVLFLSNIPGVSI